MNYKNIIFFFPHGVGDVVNATPLVQALRYRYPESNIVIIARSHNEIDLFGGPTRIDDSIIFDIHIPHKIKEIFSLMKKIWKIKPDLIISQHGIDPLKYPLFAFFSRAKFRIGEKKNVFSFLLTNTVIPNNKYHKVINHWRLLEEMGITDKFDPYVHIPYSEFENLNLMLTKKNIDLKNKKYLVIHPGSGKWEKHKRWPKEKYVELVKKIINHYLIKIIMVGTNEEKEDCTYIFQNTNNRSIISLNSELNIKMLAALLKNSLLVIGADSGVMHIASAVGTRTISLFGPTPADWTKPFNNSTIITSNMNCSPCYHKMQFGCGNPECMEKIEVDYVFYKISELLKENINAKEN